MGKRALLPYHPCPYRPCLCLSPCLYGIRLSGSCLGLVAPNPSFLGTISKGIGSRFRHSDLSSRQDRPPRRHTCLGLPASLCDHFEGISPDLGRNPASSCKRDSSPCPHTAPE